MRRATADVHDCRGRIRKLFVPGDAAIWGGSTARRAADARRDGARSDRGGVAHGPLAYRLRHGGRDYVNPTLALARGERVRITLDNRLDAPTIVHWHGLAVDTANDGNGLVLAAPRTRYEYDFEVRDRGALYWYHRIRTATPRGRCTADCSV